MGIDSHHPHYDEHIDDWILMRDSSKGERAIKDQGEKYLPATDGMHRLGMQTNTQLGYKAYQAYKTRAVYPGVVRGAVEAMLGVMHHKPPVIELPKAMEPMLERVTPTGESLATLLRRINEEQLLTGRLGLCLDVLTGATVGTLPYIAMYKAETVLNWDDGTRDGLVQQNLNFVSLDESEFERIREFEWEFKKKYRVMILGSAEANEPAGQGVYKVGVVRDDGAAFNEANLIVPSLGGKTLGRIPFVFINTKDVVPCPDTPPLLSLAELALTIYRGEADYRQALFMQGQDTLVVIGETDTERSFLTGANSVITVPLGGDAKYIGVDSAGLPEMREALQNDKAEASQKGGQLLDSVSRERESGDALKVRVAARTATLNQLAMAGAFGLQSLLRIAAEWIGADPKMVTVEPNLDFADQELSSKELVELVTAKSLGAPLSKRSIHDLMREKDMTKRTYEEELEEIAEEAPEETGNDGDGPMEGEDEPPVEEEDEEQ